MAKQKVPKTKNGVSPPLFLEVINRINEGLLLCKTEEELLQRFAALLLQELGLLSCAIYLKEHTSFTMQRIAIANAKESEGNKKKGIVSLEMDESAARVVGQSGETLIINDLSHPKDVPFEVFGRGAAFFYPLLLEGVVYAVISCQHSQNNFFTKDFTTFFKASSFSVTHLLVKIRERTLINNLKENFQKSLSQKDLDLDATIDRIASQYTELKYQGKKQELLISEVHHRVANNLQIISSILRLYKNSDKPINSLSLSAIYDRIQVMSIIYQNRYKSMELDYVDVCSFLHDVCCYLSEKSKKSSIRPEIQVDIHQFPLKISIPLGLLITELFLYFIQEMPEQLDLEITLTANNQSEFIIIWKDQQNNLQEEKRNLSSIEGIHGTLIGALSDQLDTEIKFLAEDKKIAEFSFTL